MTDGPVSREKRRFLERLKEARIGDVQAQYDVALMYANGMGIKKSVDQAVLWTQAAADKGHAAAQYLLAKALETGQGLQKNERLALYWLGKSAEKLYPKAMLRIARLLDTPQPELAFAHAQEAAERGLDEAQLLVADCYATGSGITQNLKLASEWYERAAAQGLAAAQFALGQMAESGVADVPNISRAKDWYRKAARQGMPAAQLALARLDVDGGGRASSDALTGRKTSVRERRKADARWLQYVAKGDANDLYHLGRMFELGVAVEKSAKQARLWYQKAAERGQSAAMVALAQLLGSADPERAEDLLRTAAQTGNAEAQRMLAEKLKSAGHSVSRMQEAFHWLSQSAWMGNPQAQMALARQIQDHAGPLVWGLLLAAAEGGHPDAQYAVGDRYLRGDGVDKDLTVAHHWFELAAEQGFADAQCVLGDSYLMGRVFAENRANAFYWYERAAAQKHPRAQWNLGELYATGVPGVQPDAKQAALLCRKSADAGFAPAQATLGNLFAKANKHDRAVYWWMRAAEQDDLEALYNLGQAHATGTGVPKDPTQAFACWIRAARAGLSSAQSKVGWAYATGQGQVHDAIEAARWFILAAKQGDDAARQNAERSRSMLSPAQWAEAERRATDTAAAYGA